ncbi:MAG: hypothetical protein A2W18_01160 [Candidatus Muproteobacteria bacterium RBG_16_60_9]|uniref:Uncharacterized protein n=1 Tax=Candidatus Muproteobacteria bacterium RBG_16_60_9 TaxID=1817755 RepID=A0A1F6VFG9_9PROT|nr:MAG: hypothetical protein A2W18_01160 [Candidatus Muproteobacteria bacterium RBG_16_60_9]
MENSDTRIGVLDPARETYIEERTMAAITWKRALYMTVFCAFAVLYSVAYADDRGHEIIERVVEKYRSMKSYQDIGTATAPQKDHPAFNFTRKFATTFVRPELFKHEWTHNQEKGICRGMSEGAIWGDGRRFYYYSRCGSYGFQESEEREDFLHVYGNIGEGNRHHTYHLLFLERQPRLHKTDSGKYDAVLVGEEGLASARKAYVVSVQQYYARNHRVKYWVEKDSFLILKYEAPAIGGISTIELSKITHDVPLPESTAKREFPYSAVVIQQATQAVKDGDVNKGITLLQQALSKHYDRDLQFMLATMYLFAGDDEGGLSAAEKAAEDCNPAALKFVKETYSASKNRVKTYYWDIKSQKCYGQ